MERIRLTPLQWFDHVAGERINQERGQVYGDPAVNFRRIAALQAVVDECPDPVVRVALHAICTKIARLVQTPDHLDSWIDIAGYARTGVMVAGRDNAAA